MAWSTYGEGIESLPKVSEAINANPQEISGNDVVIRSRRFQYALPSIAITHKLLSDTSNAKDCFIHRKNSRKLQKHLLNYAMVVVGTFNITLEN